MVSWFCLETSWVQSLVSLVVCPSWDPTLVPSPIGCLSDGAMPSYLFKTDGHGPEKNHYQRPSGIMHGHLGNSELSKVSCMELLGVRPGLDLLGSLGRNRLAWNTGIGVICICFPGCWRGRGHSIRVYGPRLSRRRSSRNDRAAIRAVRRPAWSQHENSVRRDRSGEAFGLPICRIV
jgi:hypothetical protein